MDLMSRQLVWRAGLLVRRAALERRRRLVREIADFRTPAEREELVAAIDRCPSAGREEIHRLLVRAIARAEDERTPLHLRT